MDARQILDREFLEIRARLLEVAASLDRLDRADGSVADDPRFVQLRQALERLNDPGADRAADLQQVFSRPYDAAWLDAWGL